MTEPAADGEEPLEHHVELRGPEEENEDLVAEAEAVAAGWMLDFLCLSLCRAFRDGRSEDFRRTRDSAEGECGPRPASPARARAGWLETGRGLRRAAASCLPHAVVLVRQDNGNETHRAR